MQQQKPGVGIDVAKLKGMIVNKLGVERSKRYFYYLNRFLNLKLSKSEFDKLCQRVLGRNNLPLHNQLLQSVLKNVCSANTRRPVGEEFPAKTATEVGQGQGRLWYEVTGTSAVTWANGVASPRNVRVDSRDRKDRNQHRLAEKDKDNTMPAALGRQCPSRVAVGLQVSLDRKDTGLEQYDRLCYSFSPLLATLGVPFCSASIGGSHKAFSATATDPHLSYFNSGELSETETLRTRMEMITFTQNLGGVSLECANLLNRMLDLYLKGLIMSCKDLVEAKSEDETKRHSVLQKQLVQGNYLNGMLPNNQHHMVTSGGMGTMYKERPHPAVSFLDFKVAMELNPQQLGEDWPSLFEKILMYSFKD